MTYDHHRCGQHVEGHYPAMEAAKAVDGIAGGVVGGAALSR
jgi:hypothetical protein